MTIELRLEAVNYVYQKETPYEQKAIEEVTLTVGGGFTGVIGASGSGKSTLLQLMSGLLAPTSGRVSIAQATAEGSETNSTPRFLRDHVGLVFQFPEQQLFEETVGKDVSFGPLNRGLSRVEVDERVDSALSLMGLPPAAFRDRSPFALSGGEMRRVAIASVLAMRPSFLVLDEPTAGLDPAGKAELIRLLRDLNREHGIGIVIASHSMDEVFANCDRIVVLHEGQVLLDKPTYQVPLAKETLHRVGVTLPALAQIAERMRARDLLADAGPLPIHKEQLIEKLADQLLLPSKTSSSAREGI